MVSYNEFIKDKKDIRDPYINGDGEIVQVMLDKDFKPNTNYKVFVLYRKHYEEKSEILSEVREYEADDEGVVLLSREGAISITPIDHTSVSFNVVVTTVPKGE